MAGDKVTGLVMRLGEHRQYTLAVLCLHCGQPIRHGQSAVRWWQWDEDGTDAPLHFLHRDCWRQLDMAHGPFEDVVTEELTFPVALEV
jgi:hypothetical protein